MVAYKKHYSWSIPTNNDYVAIKKIDKSFLMHNSTGVPRTIRNFFEKDFDSIRDKQLITINYNSANFNSYYRITDQDGTERARIEWNNDLRQALLKDLISQNIDLQQIDNVNIKSLWVRIKPSHYALILLSRNNIPL